MVSFFYLIDLLKQISKFILFKLKEKHNEAKLLRFSSCLPSSKVGMTDLNDTFPEPSPSFCLSMLSPASNLECGIDG